MRRMLLSVLALAFLLFPACAQAEPTRVDCDAVSLNGDWAIHSLDRDAYAWCPLALEQNGRLLVMVQTRFSPAQNPFYIALLDENLETVVRESVYSGGAADPKTWSATFDLTAGTYWLRVESWNGVCGDFCVRAEFTPSLGEETAGDTFDTAQRLDVPTIRGFLSSAADEAFFANPLPEASQNLRDYYLLDVGNRGFEVTLTAIADGSSFACILYDSAFRELDRAYDNPRFNVEPIDGSCYLCVENAGRAGGDYLLSIAWQDD